MSQDLGLPLALGVSSQGFWRKAGKFRRNTCSSLQTLKCP